MSRVRVVLTSQVAIAVAAVVILGALLGVVFVVATSPGCRFAAGAGLHLQGAACGRPAALVVSSPKPSPSPTPLASPSDFPSPSPIPSPSPRPILAPYQYEASGAIPPDWTYAGSPPAPSSLVLNCRLPIYSGQSGSGGFLVFPGRNYIADPRSAVSLPIPPAGAQGQSFPTGLTYDQAYDRWLPVPRTWVSPDGRLYAYTYPGTDGIYFTSVTAGGQTKIGAGHSWNLIDVESAGAYAAVVTTPGQPAAGLWLVPFTGSPVQITTLGYWNAVGGGAAYGSPTSAVHSGVANVILRLDLKTGASQPWFTADYSSSTVIGFDTAGNPLIETNVNDPRGGNYYWGPMIWLVPGLGQGHIVVSNAGGAFTGALHAWPAERGWGRSAPG